MVENMDKTVLSRRKSLTRLGLAAAVVYAAPTITHIDGEALATKKSRPSGHGGSKSKSRGSKSRGSKSRGSKSRGSKSR